MGIAASTKRAQQANNCAEIDLTSLVPTLDNTASDIVTYQRDSAVQRKDLSQKTKDFRKLDDASKLAEVKGLLKAYQGFIDLLSNHSKSTNSAFLQVYSSLSEAPDPYPLLEASVDSLLLSEDTLPKLTSENEHLQKSVSQLSSQLSETESRLESERTARKVLEGNLEAKVNDVESSWAAVLEEKRDNWEAKEKTLEDKVENQERLLKEIKATYEVSQRLGEGENDGEARGSASNAELEILNSVLERTSLQLAEAEARNQKLQAHNEQLRINTAQQKPSQAAVIIEEEPAYKRLRDENSELREKLDTARAERDVTRRKNETEIRSLKREIANMKKDLNETRDKLQRWSDYDQVKQELEVLKSIEFSTGDDDERVSLDSNEGSAAKAKGGSLEELLLARNKKLSDELTILRVSHQDMQSRLENLQQELNRTTHELKNSQRLNSTLENDLATVQQESSNAFPSGASHAGTYKSYAPSAYQSRRGGRASPTSSIVSGLSPREHMDGSGGGSSILPMITAQRDRFKKLNTQLSHELSETHKTVTSLRSEIASLQKDNLNLYEKTRYISSHSRPGAASSGTGNLSQPSTLPFSTSSSQESALGRYSSSYESNLSPFARFRGRESTRAYKRMSLPERIVFSITRMVLATRTSRNLFAAYCVALHLLVFISLYWVGMAGDSNIHKVTAGGMGGVGGGIAGGSPMDEADKWKVDDD